VTGKGTELRRFLGLAAGYLSISAFAQLLNMVGGLAIVWALDVNQYAYYTAAMSAVALGAGLADLGLSHAVISLGAKESGFPALGRLLGAAMLEKRRLSMIGCSVGGLTALTMTWWIGAGVGEALFIGAVVAFTVWHQATVAILNALFSVLQAIGTVARTTLVAAGARLAAIAAFLWMFPAGIVALAANLASMQLQRWLGGREGSRIGVSPTSAPAGKVVEVRAFYRPLVPGWIYQLLQGNVGIGLLALSGATAAVAQVGALSRLTQMVMLLSGVFSFVVYPAMARHSGHPRYRSTVVMFILAAFATLLLVGTTAYAWPQVWLVVLGSTYADQSALVPWAVAAGLQAIFGGLVYNAVVATGRTARQWLQLPLAIVAQAGYVMVFGVATALDAIRFAAVPWTSYLLLQLFLLAGALSRRSERSV